MDAADGTLARKVLGEAGDEPEKEDATGAAGAQEAGRGRELVNLGAVP